METKPHQSAAPHRHIPALDGLRGTAVLMVVFFHYGGGGHAASPVIRFFAEFEKLGASGVTLFFLLSGFLITGILWDSRHRADRWRTFFIRRTLRIAPLYYLTLLALLISVLLGPQPDAAKHILLFSVYGQNLLSSGSYWVHLPGLLKCYHLWSLAVEEQFYLLWPFLIWRISRLRSAQQLCIATFLFSLACRFFHFKGWGDYEFTAARVGELAVGAWMALALRAQSSTLRQWQRHAGKIAAVCAIVIAICGLHDRSLSMGEGWVWIAGVPALSFLYGSVLLAILHPGAIERFFSARLLRYFGTISYGLYIFHVLLYDVAEDIARHIAPHSSANTISALKLVAMLVLCIPLAAASFRWFEQPFLRLKDRLTSNAAKPTPGSYAPSQS